MVVPTVASRDDTSWLSLLLLGLSKDQRLLHHAPGAALSVYIVTKLAIT